MKALLSCGINIWVTFLERIKRLIKNEILPSGDELSQWCISQLPNDFFIDTSPFIREYSAVIRNVASLNKYTPNAISEFSDSNIADAFLVASALSLNVADDYVLVTEEVSDPQRKKRVKIPDVCPLFNVRWINTIGMFKELNIQI